MAKEKRRGIRKKRHKPCFIYEEVYKQNFYVSYGISETALVEAVKHYLAVDLPKCNGDGRCLLLENGKGSTIVWIWTRTKSVDDLAHECMHAVHYTLSDRKMPLTDDTDEAYAYLLQMLMRLILERTKRRGKGKK